MPSMHALKILDRLLGTARFRDLKTLQKPASAHASNHYYFNHHRHLNSRAIFKQNRSAALAEWPWLVDWDS
jgi:putative transposase